LINFTHRFVGDIYIELYSSDIDQVRMKYAL